MTSPKPDFLPTASIGSLQKRASILQDIRKFFHHRGFFEVETPLLSHDIVVDQHLHPIRISKREVTPQANADDLLWLQTSPEFGMKRLLAAGAQAIFQIGKAFRCDEQSKRHNPEFTMLEWYRVGDDMDAGMKLLAELVEQILKTSPAHRMSYRAAFKKYVGVDPMTDSLETLVGKAGEDWQGESDRDEILNYLLATRVEQHLGVDSPTILFDYPASQSALAQTRSDEGVEVAERFEIYVDGVELANGYHELLDASELQRRNTINNQRRTRDGHRKLPTSSRLSAAMEAGMPACAGTALGVDRLVMLALGANSIDEVIAFPLDRA